MEENMTRARNKHNRTKARNIANIRGRARNTANNMSRDRSKANNRARNTAKIGLGILQTIGLGTQQIN